MSCVFGRSSDCLLGGVATRRRRHRTLTLTLTLTLTAWHCLWQRFPHQRAARSAPPPESALGTAADELYNLSRSGRATRRLVQYLIMTGVTQVEARVSRVVQP